MHYIKMNPMTDVPSQQPSHSTHQPQLSHETIYQNTAKCEVMGTEQELDSMPEVHTQQLITTSHRSLELNHGSNDEPCQDRPDVREKSDFHSLKAAMKKMKLVLVIMVIINIVLLFTTIVIVGSTHSGLLKCRQPICNQNLSAIQFSKLTALINDNISWISTQLNGTKRELTALSQGNISQIKSDVDQLTVETNNSLSQISMQVNGANSDISELSTFTHNAVNQISTQLNSNITSALNQLDTAQTNISHISTELNAAKCNITSMQSQVVNLQMQVASLRTQVGYLHPCGPGEWHRVAYLNMSDPTQQCPSAWSEYNTGGVRACGRPSSSGTSCAAMTYSIDFQYKRVCGRVVGYQFGTPDGFHPTGTIDVAYADGVSITSGSPREHVWTYVAGICENCSYGASLCPCSSNPGNGAPTFVGHHFYCESGNPSDTISGRLYTGDKLWDGKQCEGSCCAGTDIYTSLWFKVQLSTTTSDDIEIRICGDEESSNEDTPVELVEVYAAQYE